MLRVNSAGLCSCTLLQAPALVPPGQQPRPGAAAFGFRREGHKAFKNICQEIKKGLENWLQGWAGSVALALSFRLGASVPAMLPPPPGLLASLPPPTSGRCRQRTAMTFPFPPQAGPQRPLYAQPQRLEEGASSPSPAATGNAEPGGQGPAGSSSRGGQAAQRRGLHHAGARRRAGEGGRALEGGGRGPGSSCLCDYQTPKKGKGLGKLIALGRAPASDCL